MDAGKLKDRLRFDQRELDANGDRLGEWVEGFTVWANIEYLRGTESAVNQRLQGNQPVVITIRESNRAKTIDASFRAVDVRTQAIYNVKAAAPGRDAGDISIVGLSGPAEG